MKKFIYKNIWAWLLFSFWFFWWIILLVKAAWLTATTWEPLTVSKWTDMAANFFWWSGSGGIYYNGKVWIWINAPNKSLHIKTSAGTNAELDLQSWDLPHWAIYQDESTKSLAIRNWVIRTSISTWWNLNAQWLCINWVCKTDWNQVWWWSVWVFQFTWTSDVCNLSNVGKVRYNSPNKDLEYCDSLMWKSTSTVNPKWTVSNPWLSCKDVLTSWWSNWNWLYWIKPNMNASFQVYCDMTTDGWWWTLVARMYNATATLKDRSMVWTISSPDQITDAKLSDEIINLIRWARVSSVLRITSWSLKSFHQENKEFCSTCDWANAILKASSSVSGPWNSCTQRNGHYWINNYACSVDYIIYAYWNTWLYPTSTGTLRVKSF